ncbi:MAG: transglutaminase domain-containing protein [Oscillospiraceae bacterium]
MSFINRRNIAVLAAGAVVVTTAVVVGANFCSRRSVPEFTYSTQSGAATENAPESKPNDSNNSESSDGSAEQPVTDNSISAEAVTETAAGEIDPETTNSGATDIDPANESSEPSPPETDTTASIMLCGDPLNSVFVRYDGSRVIVSGTCPEDTALDAELTFGSTVYPEISRSGADYELFLTVDGIWAHDTLRISVTFGEDKLSYTLFTSADGFSDGGFSEIAAINSAAVDNVSELSAEYTAEYILPDGTPEQRAQIMAQITELSGRICGGITDDYDKARAIARWVSQNIYYDLDAKNDRVDLETVSLAHILETHRTVCIGFSNLYSALCAAQGLTCYNVNGDCLRGALDYETRVNNTGLHEWNVVVIDGRIINVDTVWNTSNSYSNGQYTDGTVTAEYFDIGDIVFSQAHRARKAEHRDYFG